MAASLLLVSLLAVSGVQARDGTHGPVLAIEVGQAGMKGEGSTVYETSGLGKAIVLGYRWEGLGLEWHTAQAYHLSPATSAAQGDLTGGELKLSTLGLRYTFQRRYWLVSAVAGMTRARLPLLVVDPAVTSEGNVLHDDIMGVGPLAGAGVGLPIPRTALQLIVEGRTAWCRWEQPLEYIDAIDDSGDVPTWTTSTEPIEGQPWTLSLGLRAVL